MARHVTVTIPEEVDEAIRAEAYRVGCRPGEVLSRWLRDTFPEYVFHRLSDDLRHPEGRLVIDVEASDSPDEKVTRAGTDGASRLTSAQPQVARRLSLGDLSNEESPGADR